MKGHRWFAATYDLLLRGAERRVLSRLRPLVAGEATGRVLEIGAGTGANFPHYRRASEVVATEPDPYMLRRARARAAALGGAIRLGRAPVEALPFSDASFDAVVSTLVLCSVEDQARALAEVRRVLKPRGELRFIEHVRGDGRLGRLHDLLTPLWRRLGGGCRPNRRTAEQIAAAGFELVELRRRALPLMPLVVGVARRPT